MLLVAHVTCVLGIHGLALPSRCLTLLAAPISWGFHSSLGFAFTAAQELSAEIPSLLLIVRLLWLSEPCCKPHNLLLQTAGLEITIVSTTFWCQPKIQPGPWPTCTVASVYLWQPRRVLPLMAISQQTALKELSFRHHHSNGLEILLFWILNGQREFPSSPFSSSQCEPAGTLTLTVFVCIHLGHNFELFVLPSPQTLPFPICALHLLKKVKRVAFKVVNKIVTKFNLSDSFFMPFSETLFYFVFLRPSHHVVHAGFELTRLQLQSTKYRNWSICPPTPLSFMLGQDDCSIFLAFQHRPWSDCACYIVVYIVWVVHSPVSVQP